MRRVEPGGAFMRLPEDSGPTRYLDFLGFSITSSARIRISPRLRPLTMNSESVVGAPLGGLASSKRSSSATTVVSAPLARFMILMGLGLDHCQRSKAPSP